jgi:hypothetical protein
MTRAELDPNLKQAAAVGTPVEVVDPITNEMFYLVSAEQFRVIATAIAGDFDPREGYPLIDKVMAEDDADDPLLDSYQ